MKEKTEIKMVDAQDLIRMLTAGRIGPESQWKKGAAANITAEPFMYTPVYENDKLSFIPSIPSAKNKKLPPAHLPEKEK